MSATRPPKSGSDDGGGVRCTSTNDEKDLATISGNEQFRREWREVGAKNNGCGHTGRYVDSSEAISASIIKVARNAN